MPAMPGMIINAGVQSARGDAQPEMGVAMNSWLAMLVSPAALGAVLGGAVTFAGTEGARYYYFERTETSAEVKEARAEIKPLIDPLPKTSRDAGQRIVTLRGKRLLFQSEGAKGLFALAIGHLDEYKEELDKGEKAERERRRQLAREAAAKGRNDAPAADQARRAAANEARKVTEAKRAASSVSKLISKLPRLAF